MSCYLQYFMKNVCNPSPALRMLKSVDLKFKTDLCYIVRGHQRNKGDILKRTETGRSKLPLELSYGDS